MKELVYSAVYQDLVERCSRLRIAAQRSGRRVAAFSIPSRLFFQMEAAVGHELRGLTMYGVPVHTHNGRLGVIAEKGSRCVPPDAYRVLEWRHE